MASLPDVICDCSECKTGFPTPPGEYVQAEEELKNKPFRLDLAPGSQKEMERSLKQVLIQDLIGIDPSDINQFGGKACSLARMITQGLPVPPGFVIPTVAARECVRLVKSGVCTNDHFVDHLMKDIRYYIKGLEEKTGKIFGEDLFVSVRSGAPVSMPGMMDTILNVGISSSSYNKFIETYNSIDLFHRLWKAFLAQYGQIALSMNSSRLNNPEEMYKGDLSIATNTPLTQDQTYEMISRMELRIQRQFYKQITDPYECLEVAVRAVIESWNSKRAKVYRQQNNISDDMGTAVAIVAMVYGNASEDSGTGVCFTRNPSTGEKRLYGEYLVQAQGEDIVSGTVTPKDISLLQETLPNVYDELVAYASFLEVEMKDMQDIEFTVERGKLWLLQHRDGKRTTPASVKIAVDMVHEGLITQEEAVNRVPRFWLDIPQGVRFDDESMLQAKKNGQFITAGTPASGGIATGYVAYDTKEVENFTQEGKDSILFRQFTTPDDLSGMLKSVGIVTLQGGTTSHAAVVARELNKPCIVGCDKLSIGGSFAPKIYYSDGIINSGELVSICGTDGSIFKGSLEESRARDEFEETYTILKDWHTIYTDRPQRAVQTYVLSLPRANIEGELIPTGLAYKTFRNKCWWPELNISLNITKMCADFYLLSNLAKDNPQYARAFIEYSEVVAKEIAVYLDAAVGGEARHMKPSGFMGLNGNHLSRTLARKGWRKLRIEKGMLPLHKLADAYNNTDGVAALVENNGLGLPNY